MRNQCKLTVLLLAAIMVSGMLVVPGGNVQAAELQGRSVSGGTKKVLQSSYGAKKQKISISKKERNKYFGKSAFIGSSSGVGLKSCMQLNGHIYKKKGKSYYKYEDGKLAKKKFVTVGKHTYYFNKKGVMEKGWMKKKGNYYYFDRQTGKQKFNCKVDGIKIRKDGTAKLSTYTKNKIDTMITAKKIMQTNTKTTDSRSKKLKKVFNWVLKHPYKRYRTLKSVQSKKGWEITFANDVYKKGQGCCVSEASAFAFLAHECGYKNVYICDDTGHAWTEINGRVYDTLFAEAKNYNKYYNSSYGTAGLHRVGKLKI